MMVKNTTNFQLPRISCTKSLQCKGIFLSKAT